MQTNVPTHPLPIPASSQYKPPISTTVGDACQNHGVYACSYDASLNLNTIVSCINSVVTLIGRCPGIGSQSMDYSCAYFDQSNSQYKMPYCVAGPKPTGPPAGYVESAAAAPTSAIPLTSAPVQVAEAAYVAPISSSPGETCKLHGVYACGYDFEADLNTIVACFNGVVTFIGACKAPDFKCAYFDQTNSAYKMPYCVTGAKPTAAPPGISRPPNSTPSTTPAATTIPARPSYVPLISTKLGEPCSYLGVYACGFDYVQNLNTIVACLNGIVTLIDSCPGKTSNPSSSDYGCAYFKKPDSAYMMPYCVAGSKPTGPPGLGPATQTTTVESTATRTALSIPSYTPSISINPGDACNPNQEGIYACSYDFINNLNTIVGCFRGLVALVGSCPGKGNPFQDYSCVYFKKGDVIQPYCVQGPKPTAPPPGIIEALPSFTTATKSPGASITTPTSGATVTTSRGSQIVIGPPLTGATLSIISPAQGSVFPIGGVLPILWSITGNPTDEFLKSTLSFEIANCTDPNNIVQTAVNGTLTPSQRILVSHLQAGATIPNLSAGSNYCIPTSLIYWYSPTFSLQVGSAGLISPSIVPVATTTQVNLVNKSGS
ncbi:hypothetical protein BDR26DRAFT_871946, partial [Obelidium mucronatum]